MNLDGLLHAPLEATLKGLPDGLHPEFSLADVAAAGWNLLRGDVPLPAATIDAAAMAANSRWMRSFTESHGVLLCPHGKTTMAPQLFRQQLDDGAWGITVATGQQLQVCRRFGVRRVLLANQLVDQGNLDTVLRALRDDPDLDFYALVDSAENLAQLRATARRIRAGRPLQLLIELGVPGGRSGCRSLGSALALAEEVGACTPLIELRGVEGFEGMIDGTDEEAARDYVGRLCALLQECRRRRLVAGPRPVLSIGGSIFFDLAATHPEVQALRGDCDVVLRSGCYLTHDSLMLTKNFERIRARTPAVGLRCQAFRPALSVWGAIQSLPEPGLAIVNVGKRDVSHDVDLPVAERWYRSGHHAAPAGSPEPTVVEQINDQHLFLRIQHPTRYRVGDLVGLGLSHPCTTFDKWRLLYVINDGYDITAGIRTFF